MLFAAGSSIGSYDIVGLIGTGGMGEVYRARDRKLHRDVALKILPEAFATDAERLTRFEREARVLAALNHPHIAQIYGVEESNGTRALVIELVEGETLAERIRHGPLPLDEALALAQQVAEALEAAHEQGIIHRDLKPANIAVRSDGTVKVLDFGLAKLVERSGVPTAPESAETETQVGIVLGSVPYMAPEQAKGKPVDRRADLWAFGCVLFEMLSGRRAFPGETTSDVLGQILEREPDWQRLPPKTPARVRALLQRCLAKDPKRRLDSAAVARLEIDDALAAPSHDANHATPFSQSVPRARWRRLGAVTIFGAAIVAASIWLARDRQSLPAVPRLQNAVQVTSTLGVESYPTWSPDGTRVAYQASEGHGILGDFDIWVAQLGTGEPINLTKGSGANDRKPSWSPDGREIAFFSDRDGTWGVYLVGAIGGPPRRVLTLPEIGSFNWSAPQWSKDGTTLFVSVSWKGENVVIVLSLASLETSRVLLPRHERNVCFDLSVSPDGGRFAYVEGGEGGTEITRLWTIPASGGDPVALTDGRTNVWSPAWSGNGRSIFYTSNRGGTMDLWQQAIAPDGAPIGQPLPVTQGIGMRSAVFSPDGTRLAYSRRGTVTNVLRVPIVADRPATWADARPLISERAYIEFIDVSPDSHNVAVSSDRRGNQDLWVIHTGGGEMTPLTTDPTPDWDPRWSPDGSEIAFYSYRSGNRDLWVMPSAGGPARRLTTSPAQDRTPRWSPDGREILFHSVRPDGAGNWIVDASGGEPRFLAPTDDVGGWSPDGDWVVIPRRDGLYRVATNTGEAVLLRATGEKPYSPRFSHDGRWIYYAIITGPPENRGIWQMSLEGRTVSRLTQLDGRRGQLGYVFAADAQYLYLLWREDEGDIWVMDVVQE